MSSLGAEGEKRSDLYSWSKAYTLETGTHGFVQYFTNKSGRLEFRVRAEKAISITLSAGSFRRPPFYEFTIGEEKNTKTSLRKNGCLTNLVQVPTPDILDGNKFSGFWIRWAEQSIKFGREGDPNPIISWIDQYIPILYVGFCTLQKSAGSFLIKRALGHVGDGYWVQASSGDVPPLAVVGGYQGNTDFYIARAEFQGLLLPGVLRKGDQDCGVCLQGSEYQVGDYEILCECYGRWVLADENNIPRNAIPAGRDKNGEPIYIGRVTHSSGIILGKVHCGICYFSIDGNREMSRSHFFILVSHDD